MARIRTIKPEFWTSEQVASCSPMARLLFIGIWNFADDGGVHPDSAARLKMEILPADAISIDDVAALLDELISNGLLERYEADGKSWLHVTGWQSHQRIDKPSYRYPSRIGLTPRTSRRESRKDLSTSAWRKMRARVLREDGPVCVYCGRDCRWQFTVDHVVPVSRGGTMDRSNLVIACRRCNARKGAK